MKHMLHIFLILASLSVFAEEECDETPNKLKPLIEVANAAAKAGCPNKNKLAALCLQIKTRSESATPVENNKYNYYKSILEASCSSETDSPEVKNTKIRDMWSRFEDDLKCSDTTFEVTNGNVIKYGVAMNFDRFIRDVTRWGVNLNKVDEADGRTVLDYVRDMIAKYKGNSQEAKLQMYYNQLKKAGAKHKSEL